MSTIAEFTIEPGPFFLDGLIETVPDLDLALERVVPIGPQLMPYLWCYTDDIDAVERELAAQESIASVTRLDHSANAALYRIEWRAETGSFVEGLHETDATLLEARASDAWTIRLQFEDRRDVRGFHRYLTDHDVTYTLDRVFAAADDATDPIDSLTDLQREALALAASEGYFRVPRGTSIAAIGRQLGISEQATSERIRRGVDALLRDSFHPEP
jgi:hypothetical protein